MNLVDQFLRGVDVPGDVFHHLECADIDACKPQD
jgi:hypothetical protein